MLKILTKRLVIKIIQAVLWIIDGDHRHTHEISSTDEKKFTHTKEVDFESDFANAINAFRTVPYVMWQIQTKSTELLAADKHLIKTPSGLQWLQDLSVGDLICTKYGDEKVVKVKDLNIKTHMYDLEINSEDHLYYTSNVLSHNSTSAAGYLLWYAMFVPDSTILVAAHQYSGSQEIMQRIRYAYEDCPNHIRAGVVSYNKGSIEFDNGSRIVSSATTENTGRGLSISLLYLDEFAFVRPNIAKEFWTSISPTLATGGKCIITSTPNSDEDQFAILWKGANKTLDEFGNTTHLGKNGFRAFRSYWEEHPDRDEKWGEEQLAQLGEARFKREIKCEFIIWEETLINALHLVTMEPDEPIERQGQVRWFKKPDPKKTYAVALDPSLGTGGDPAAIQVLELPSMEQVAEWQHNKTPIQKQVAVLIGITQYLTGTVPATQVYYSIENNTLGEAALVVISDVGEENIPGVFLSEPYKPGQARRYRKGFNTTHRSKLTVCAKLKHLVESDRLTLHSAGLLSELKTFVAHGTSFAAKIGDTDDLVMSLILAIRMAQMLQSYDSELDSYLKDSMDDIIVPMPFIIV